MFRIAGKQRWGSVYRDGKRVVSFRSGVGYTDSVDDAEYLREQGYTVEGSQTAPEPPPMESDEMTLPDSDPTVEGAQYEQDGGPTELEAVPMMGVNPRRGRKSK